MSDQSWFDSNLPHMYIFKKINSALLNASSQIWSSLKFLFPRFIGYVSVNFLRKTNTFIKSKYSKNRQWSKSIVYFGLWFGVISAFTFTYFNYRFLFTLSYIWWLPATIVFIILFNAAKKQSFSIKSAAFNLFW